MKKDIQIPEVKNVHVAIVFEYNDIYKTDDWNVYVINNKNTDLEMMVIVSQGFSETKTTSVLRKKITLLPANSFAKIELIQPDLFKLNNRFQVSFFDSYHIFYTRHKRVQSTRQLLSKFSPMETHCLEKRY